MLRFDLVWDLYLVQWAILGFEIDGGLGNAEPVVGAVENGFLSYVYAAPVFRIQLGRLDAFFALRVAPAAAWEWARLVTSLDLSLGF